MKTSPQHRWQRVSDHFTGLASVTASAFDLVRKTDIHTHLYPPRFGDLCFTHPDLLLTYHYLVCEALRFRPGLRTPSPKAFAKWPLEKRAEFIWTRLFLKFTPVSEATRGVLYTLNGLEIEADAPWRTVRAKLLSYQPERLIEIVLQAAGLESVTGTNDPLHPDEQKVWLGGRVKLPAYYNTALRLDSAILAKDGAASLNRLGYQVNTEWDSVGSFDELRRYVREWAGRMNARYTAISLPPTFSEDSLVFRLLSQAVIPEAQELGIPAALMLGVERGWNAELGQAGDGVGRTDLSVLRALAQRHPKALIYATVLSPEDEFELNVTCRKFPNVIPFGGWWWRNSRTELPKIVDQRLALLNTAWIGNNSDARHWLQLPYKWFTTRQVFAECLGRTYSMCEQATSGFNAQRRVIRDITDLFGRHWIEPLGK